MSSNNAYVKHSDSFNYLRLPLCEGFRYILTPRYGTGSYSLSPSSWYVAISTHSPSCLSKVIQILVGILRHYVVLLLQSTPKKQSRAAIREQYVLSCSASTRVNSPFRRALARAQILRATSANSPLPPTFYASISRHLSEAFTNGTYLKDGPPKSDAPTAPPSPLTDPAAMEGMMAGMKTQMVMMVPQMIIMGWINFFFQGFVLSTSPALGNIYHQPNV